MDAFVQADMLSACMEYEDILSDKRRGAHPSPPKGREPERGLVFSNRLTSNGRHPPSLGEGRGGCQGAGYSPLPWGKATGRRALLGNGAGGGYQLRRITYPPEQFAPRRGSDMSAQGNALRERMLQG